MSGARKYRKFIGKSTYALRISRGYVFQCWASLIAPLVKNPPAKQETLVGKIRCRRDRLPTPYSWASRVAQLVKNPLAMWETWARSLGQEDPLEEGRATHSSILAWRILWTVLYSPWDHKESDTTERLPLSPSCLSVGIPWWL